MFNASSGGTLCDYLKQRPLEAGVGNGATCGSRTLASPTVSKAGMPGSRPRPLPRCRMRERLLPPRSRRGPLPLCPGIRRKPDPLPALPSAILAHHGGLKEHRDEPQGFLAFSPICGPWTLWQSTDSTTQSSLRTREKLARAEALSGHRTRRIGGKRRTHRTRLTSLKTPIALVLSSTCQVRLTSRRSARIWPMRPQAFQKIQS